MSTGCTISVVQRMIADTLRDVSRVAFERHFRPKPGVPYRPNRGFRSRSFFRRRLADLFRVSGLSQCKWENARGLFGGEHCVCSSVLPFWIRESKSEQGAEPALFLPVQQKRLTLGTFVEQLLDANRNMV
jgi:hypothetical protein